MYRETEGNQFFIDELVKSLVENGQICCMDMRWQCSDPGNLQLPQSVRATIQARVTKLPENAQEMLRLATLHGGGGFVHGFTYSHQPVAATVAREVLRILEDEALVEASQYLRR